MPKFKNTTNKAITIMREGRKIVIPKNGTIEGPAQLAMYKGLVEQSSAPSLSISKSNMKKRKDIPVIKKKSTEIRKIPQAVTVDGSAKSVTDPYRTSLMPIPKTAAVSEEHSKSKTIKRAEKFIKNYPKTNVPSIGICILSKDSLELITDCCESIFNQVKYPNTKIYIFDTGTTHTQVLEYYKKIQNNKTIPVEVINVGQYHFSRNYNDGIAQVDTDYVLIQNNDTVALNDYVTSLMKVAILDKVGLSGPRMLYKDGTIQHDGQFIYNHREEKLTNPGHVNIKQHPSRFPGKLNVVDGITAAGVLVKTELFEELGGFETSFSDIYQDVHFCIKNRMAGYLSICDTNAVIHHYDNTSRKNNWRDSNEIDKMRQDHNRLFGKLEKREIFYKKRPNPDLSIVTLVHNEKQYLDFLNDLKKQEGSLTFEVIPLPNFNNEYQSCAEALNVGISVAEGTNVILCHQDLRVPTDWLLKIQKYIDNLDHKKINWGVLGMAGASYETPSNEFGCMYLNNDYNTKETYAQHYSKLFKGDCLEVQALDELCLVIKRTSNLRFDEKICPHYHWYGADLCLNAIHKGFKNYAINAPCIHLSDGFSNLMNPKHKDPYVNGAAKLHQKWSKYFPYFKTMTAKFNRKDKTIEFFVADILKEKGIEFPKKIRVKNL